MPTSRQATDVRPVFPAAEPSGASDAVDSERLVPECCGLAHGQRLPARRRSGIHQRGRDRAAIAGQATAVKDPGWHPAPPARWRRGARRARRSPALPGVARSDGERQAAQRSRSRLPVRQRPRSLPGLVFAGSCERALESRGTHRPPLEGMHRRRSERPTTARGPSTLPLPRRGVQGLIAGARSFLAGYPGPACGISLPRASFSRRASTDAGEFDARGRSPLPAGHAHRRGWCSAGARLPSRVRSGDQAIDTGGRPGPWRRRAAT